MEGEYRRLGGRKWLDEIRRISAFAGEILFPHFCLSCGAEGSLLCPTCEVNCYAPKRGVLFTLKMPVGQNRDIRCFSVGRYADPVLRGLLHAYKYGGVEEAGDVVTRIFVSGAARQASAVLAGLDQPTVIPVPMNRFSQARRGFNQVDVLARFFAADFELEFIDNLLIKRFTFRAQAQISDVRARLKNVQDSFVVQAGDSIPEEVVLVDDVFTTGATILSCVSALRQSGVSRITVLTLLKS
jgi:competence protein ComFC